MRNFLKIQIIAVILLIFPLLSVYAENKDGSNSGKKVNDTIAELLTINIDGTGLTRLTFNSYYENHAHVSPDGTKILFTVFTKDTNGTGVGEDDMNASEIGIMDIDGSNYTLLTDNDYADFGAVWSPDGGSIIFSTNRHKKQFDIATINIDGSGFTRLTSTKKRYEMDPHRIGDIIVFTKWNPYKKSNVKIWKMNSDGSNKKRLTYPKLKKTIEGTPLGDMDPKISPDGTMVAFERHKNNKRNHGLGKYDIYTINIDGTGLRKITGRKSAEAVPTWSPDGSKLTYWSVNNKTFNAFGIFIINTDGSGRVKISKGLFPLYVEMPSWIDEDTLIFSGKSPEW